MLTIAEQQFSSRLFVGTGKYASRQQMLDAVLASGSEMATLALKRVDPMQPQDDILTPLQQNGIKLLPNTSGARTAAEAIFAAQLSHELLGCHWLKLEIHPDANYLLPDARATLQAAEALVAQGFVVLPYVHADPVLCKQLQDIGCAAVMPLAAPIGSNKGLRTRDFLQIIIEQATVPVIVDAGIGCPSDAAKAMELGADAVLVNSAIAVAGNPVAMAQAFAQAVSAGRQAFCAGLAQQQTHAAASSPLTAFLDAAEYGQ